MAFTTKLPLLLFFLFLSVTTLALAKHHEQDPQKQYQQCQRRCQKQEQHQQPQEKQQCLQQCEQQRREQEERQRGQEGSTRDPQQEFQQCQRRCQQEGQQQQKQQECRQRCEQQRQEQEERQRGQGDNTRDPQQEFQQCQRHCKREALPQRQQQCQQKCEQQLRKQEDKQRGQEGNEAHHEEEDRSQSQEQQQQGQRNNPYFLDEEIFEQRLRTQHGRTRVSRRFSQISNLLRGIENYRLGLFEANPSTFMIPHHLDADAIFFVVRGRGTINLVHQQNKESYNLERGNVIRVPAGALIYLINRDKNEQFQIASLFQPVSTPTDSFREFFGAGGQNPQSFFNTFSDEILEAAFNTDRERLERLFKEQRSGEFVEASQEQIRALTRDASSSSEGSLWPIRGSQCRGPFDLLNQRPAHSNAYGQLYRVDANDYCQLQDLDTEVAFYNISRRAMLAPFYNSRATSLVVVVEGRGHFEMVCPHLASRQGQTQGQERGSTRYQRVSAHLSPRTAFIVPAGHPVSIVASDNQNLQIVAFKVNAANNQRNYLAGQNNVLNQLERAAKELSFNMPAREVEAILNNQKNSVFLPGPNQRQQGQEGRHDGFLIETIADIMAF